MRTFAMRNSGLTRGLTQPWTHHDIIRLVAPFTEHGRQLDLEASSRTERRLVFRPRLHGVAVGGMSITEHLVLENPSRGTYRAVRDAILPDGLLSRLIAQGPEPGGVLAAIEHVPVARGIQSGKGFVVAISHVIEPFGWTPSHGAGEPTLVFKRAVAKAAGLSLTVVVSDVRGYPATAEIAAPAGETIDLPHDFLSVAGAEWRPLERVKAGWRTTLSIRGREPRLSERIEASVERGRPRRPDHRRAAATIPCAMHVGEVDGRAPPGRATTVLDRRLPGCDASLLGAAVAARRRADGRRLRIHRQAADRTVFTADRGHQPASGGWPRPHYRR